MIKNKITFLYLLMLLGHVAHIFEETWGRFFLIDAVFGLGWFLVANWVLFCIPVALFYFVLNDRPWAYYMSMIYAGIMFLNGLGHNIVTMVTGRYFSGFAGGYTGIALLLISPPMIYYLRRGMPTNRTAREETCLTTADSSSSAARSAPNVSNQPDYLENRGNDK